MNVGYSSYGYIFNKLGFFSNSCARKCDDDGLPKAVDEANDSLTAMT